MSDQGSEPCKRSTGDAADTDVFDTLSNSRRMAIFRALGDRHRESPRSPWLSFSALKERAGIVDKGNFNYHLNQLVDGLVEKQQGAYRLSMTGRRVYGILVSGETDYNWTWGPRDLSGYCAWCSEDLSSATYERGTLWLECVDGHQHTFGVPPSLLEGRPDGTWQERVARWNSNRFDLLRSGLCDLCGGRVPTRIDHERSRYHYTGTCQRCGSRFFTSVGVAVAHHPDVQAFFRERDQDIRTTPMWKLPWCTHGTETVVSEHPVQLRVDITCDGNTMGVFLDGDAGIYRIDR